MKYSAVQTAVIAILDRPRAYQWSVQGLGMLRLYIRDVGRIHIWDSRLRYPGVSPFHTHSWDLESTVVFGAMKNERLIEMPPDSPMGKLFWRKRLICGYDTREVSPPEKVILAVNSVEHYFSSDTYTQSANEIHQSIPKDGTVTLMRRVQGDHDGAASVYWPIDQEFGSAKPRDAKPLEIDAAVELALTNL
jgi:hypothetical protein